MKVLYLAHSFPRYPTDPVGSFVLRLAVALEELGVEVRVIAPGAADLPPTDVFEGVRVDRFRYAPAGFETLAYSGTMRQQVMESWTSRVAMVTFLAANYFTARRSRQSFPADVVHAHWWFPGGLVGSWLRRPWRAPLVTTMHGSDLRLAQASPLARRLFRHVLKASTT